MGAASGRVDALVFMGGLVAGIWVFAEVYAWLAGFTSSGEMGTATLAELLGIPFWLVAGLVVLMAVAMFRLIRRLERPVPGAKA